MTLTSRSAESADTSLVFAFIKDLAAYERVAHEGAVDPAIPLPPHGSGEKILSAERDR